mgnify:CR=1 FL=1
MASGITGLPTPQQTPVEERRQAVKTRTLGRTDEVHDDGFKEKLEAQRRSRKQNQEQQESDEQAEKRREAILAKVGERRHLQYDVIDDAAIVQVSVINSEDGTIVRKYPPDEVVKFVRNVKKSYRHKLDMML